MRLAMLGRKVGMTQRFDDSGRVVPVTVIEMPPCPVIQKKTKDADGYDAVQIGFGARKKNRTNKPLAGHFAKSGAEPTKVLREIRLGADDAEKYNSGDSLTLEMFERGDFVDVEGKSKGKGTAGVMKRWNFKGQPATHGVHEYFRHAGAIGQCATPARLFKGRKMPGRMGNEKTSVQNLVVIDVKAEQNLLFVRGAVPGAKNGVVMVKKSVKKSGRKANI